jgi:hypothetical protein
VGVNSQITIEKAVTKGIDDGRLKGNERFPVTMTLVVNGLDINIKFDGEVRLE